MKKFLVLVFVLMLLVVGTFFILQTKGASCNSCFSTGNPCYTSVGRIGDCQCAKRLGEVEGFCAPN